MNHDAKVDLLGVPWPQSTESGGGAAGYPWRTWFLIFLGLAVATRCVRYFAQFPLWEDECFLAVSIHQRSFSGLLQPLEYHQVAPYLFLWLEKAATSILGFDELALRLPAFLCGLGAIALFGHLARRLLAGRALVFSAALFAASYPCIRYGAEAKPYGTDLFISLGMVVLLVEWLRRPRETRWLWALALACPVAIGLSFPALFTTSAASLLVLGVMTRHAELRRWAPWLALNAAILGGSAVLYLLTVRPQLQAEQGFMGEYWADTFVPVTSIVALLKWLVTTHTGSLFAHPAGGERFGSTLTTVLLVAGLVHLFRGRRWIAALLLLLPLGLHFGSALLQRYPYGGHVKFSMYAAPMITVVVAVGCATLLGRRGHGGHVGRWGIAEIVALSLCAALGVGSIISDVIRPYKTTADLRQRALAQWLWHDGNFDDRIVCIKDDLGHSFSERTWSDLGWSAMYLCNKYIYTPRRLIREPRPSYAPPPERRYLRCVLYRDLGKGDFQQEAFDRWLAGMKQKHRFVGLERYPLPRHDKRNRRLITIDYLEIYRFEAPTP